MIFRFGNLIDTNKLSLALITPIGLSQNQLILPRPGSMLINNPFMKEDKKKKLNNA